MKAKIYIGAKKYAIYIGKIVEKTLEFLTLPATFISNRAQELKNFTIWGESVQDGTPTPDNPIEVESVGDKTKNLFDGDFVTDWSTWTGYANGKIKYFNLKPNTQYTFSSNVPENLRNNLIYVNGTSGEVDGIFEGHPVTLATDTTGRVFIGIFSSRPNYQQLIDGTYYIQIEQGDIATPYEPYGYKVPIVVNGTTTNIYLNEPLRKIGDYADYIDYTSQKVVRNVKSELLIGSDSETYTKSTTTIVDLFVYSKNAEYRIQESAIVSSRFVNRQTIGIGYIYVSASKSIALGWKEHTSSTVSDFKTWLASNNVEIIYPLNTPTQESITLPAIQLQQGTLTIDTDTNIKPSKITITGDIDNA